MDVALDKCLSKLKLDQVEKLSEEQESCLNGCLLQLFGLVNFLILKYHPKQPDSSKQTLPFFLIFQIDYPDW